MSEMITGDWIEVLVRSTVQDLQENLGVEESEFVKEHAILNLIDRVQDSDLAERFFQEIAEMIAEEIGLEDEVK